jgi:hypothetical protein
LFVRTAQKSYITALIVASFVIAFASGCTSSAPAGSGEANPPPAPTSEVAGSHKDATYTIDGRVIKLTNGVFEAEAAPGSASKLVTRYFGNEATADLNGDGTEDIVFLLTHSTGGSGTFFYAVAALKTPTGYTGTNAVLLGDRIAPQSTEYRNGEIIVNYADRKPGDAMTTQPSVGVSKYLKVDNGKLVAIR